MAKTSGLGDNFYLSGVDLSGDINSLKAIRGGPAALDFTDITQSGMARQGGERDGGIDFTSYFDPTTAHPTLSALPTADVIVSYFRGTTLGNAAACEVAKQANYDGNRAADGGFLLDVSTLANGFGLEWGLQLCAGKRTDASATSPATGVDVTDGVTVSTNFGWQAYLHVFSLGSGTVVVSLDDSANNSAFTPLTGGAFTGATGVTSQRLAGGASATVRRYVRAITTGTFTNAVFSVVFVRNMVAVTF